MKRVLIGLTIPTIMAVFRRDCPGQAPIRLPGSAVRLARSRCRPAAPRWHWFRPPQSRAVRGCVLW